MFAGEMFVTKGELEGWCFAGCCSGIGVGSATPKPKKWLKDDMAFFSNSVGMDAEMFLDTLHRQPKACRPSKSITHFTSSCLQAFSLDRGAITIWESYFVCRVCRRSGTACPRQLRLW